ncbi:rRNA-processing protein las1 [Kalmusia sp. IMI 367209]|nr:rRNA-processing protein las1 [Kalmusia sp. IMI 367209]
MALQFVVTPWRDANELLGLRRDLFASGQDAFERRERAVNKVRQLVILQQQQQQQQHVAWGAWKKANVTRTLELPLLLESTADIVDAKLRDERGGLPHSALRLVYATAISRFITGLADTQSDLARLHPKLSFPLALRETRHCIVHRHLPSLAELKRAARDSLDWLWEWYWSRLDTALAPTPFPPHLSEREARERLSAVLKSYVKERKGEVKRREKESRAAERAVESWWGVDAERGVKVRLLLELLVDEKSILPADKKLGSSMSGAYLIWTPLLGALGKSETSFLRALTECMTGTLSASSRSTISIEFDPAREGLHDWLVHILTSDEWEDARRTARNGGSYASSGTKFLEDVLSLCFTTPTLWTLKLAETLLKDEEIPERKSWHAILEAAKSDEGFEGDQEPPQPEDMDVDSIDTARPVSVGAEPAGSMTKIHGPQKKPGLWRPQPIGWIPPGWEAYE